MKKFLCLVIAVVFCFSLCSCSQGMNKALEDGLWKKETYIMDVYCTFSYEFRGDGKYDGLKKLGYEVFYEVGTYKVEDEVIVMTHEDGTTFDIEYTYEDGVLRLFDENGNEYRNEKE